ncbi:DUF4114 domain-containing protein [Xylanibacter ruminicola]|uniref:DUF4114 domain-containing protein n=1 Tax=Xylanibacter ruminicola TaxID=839 RepID=UPI000AE67CF3|nr:DUF4114 domain-containing protein [Xylanibacter ruminicola]
MKKLLSLAVFGLVLSGCTKGFDAPEPTPEPTPDPTPTGVTDEEVKANFENIFGVSYSSEQDWITTAKGSVNVTANANVKKVAIMALVAQTDEDGETFNSMTVLNEAETNGQSSLSINYDAPGKNEGLYAAFYTDNGCYYQKIEGNAVAFSRAAKTRATDVFPIPTGEFSIASSESSYAAQREGYLVDGVTDEKLYSFNDYAGLKMDAPAYTDGYANRLRDLIFAYFPNGRTHENYKKVLATGYSDDNAYRTTTGENSPIVVCPIYKCDGATKYGNEVYNSDLYYYYFKEADLNAAANKTAFLQNLPKYKLIPFNQYFGENEDDKLEKRSAYACLYFGDGTPEIGKKGTFIFPEGYKIGFMVRAKTDYAEGDPKKPRKQGELYFDGRLNTKINSDDDFNFKSSKLKDGQPRATWFKMEDRILLCWESGTDADFNDILLEVEGSVSDPETVVEFEHNTYTYCFEDRQLGDYDLNDVVIKAKRLDKTHVQYAIVACGAYDNLFVKNINAGVINDDTEIHSLFGKGTNVFINTESGAEYIEPIVVTKEVSEAFSFLDEATQPYLYDKSTGMEVKLSKKGQDPHGIMLPYDFKYPLEKVCIKDAYKEFNNWVSQNKDILGTNWYTKPQNGKVYTK